MRKKPTPIKNQQLETHIFRSRIFFAIGLVSVCLLILIARYGYLQIFQHQHFTTLSDSNRIRLQALPPARGYIFDRNGILIADNYPVFTAVLSKADIDDIDAVLKRLTPVIDLSQEDIERVKQRAETARKTELLTIKMNLNESEIARFSEQKMYFPGVRIETQMTRYYPYADLFAHVVGYVGRINDKELKTLDKDIYAGTNLIGKIGIEKSYESLLHGIPGHESIEADAHSNVLRHLGRKEATRGNDLYLSIDYGLQVVATEQLAGKRGAIVALDPNNGEILALVSSPSFNPNLFVTGISNVDYKGLRDNIDQPLYNRAVQGVYPPGSTIKPMEALGGIHYKLIDWDTKIMDPGYFHLPGDSHKFRDWKKGGHGITNIHSAIMYSCDTFFYILSYQMGIERMHEWMTRFGFGAKTGIDLPSENSGLYPSPEWKMRTRKKPWLKGETISVSIGQGAFTASPLQLAMATAITANYGLHIRPHLLRESKGNLHVAPIASNDGKIEFNGSQEDWDRIHQAMIAVIENGTGHGIRNPLYQIAGKTGTAQVVGIAQGKKYNEALLKERQLDHGLFIGFAPADKPSIAVAVIWENGRHGGSAAQLAKPVMDYWLIKRKSHPIRPTTVHINGGLMNAGKKPAELVQAINPAASAEASSSTSSRSQVSE